MPDFRNENVKTTLPKQLSFSDEVDAVLELDSQDLDLPDLGDERGDVLVARVDELLDAQRVPSGGKRIRHAGAMTEELASSLSSDTTIFDATIKEQSNVEQPWARAAFPGAVGVGFDTNAA